MPETVSLNLTSMVGVVEYVTSHSGADTVVAIDASLVVRNPAGRRPCEKRISENFGKYHASCHSTNLARLHARTGMKLVSELADHGFVHDFDVDTATLRPGKWLFEVYPHPAMIRLFGLNRIIPYKKGTVTDKRSGLDTLRRHLSELDCLRMTPIMSELLARDLDGLRGERLKRYEDTLDAAFCAYLAWHCWRWGPERNEIYGTLEDGYIVVPKMLAGSPDPTADRNTG